MIKPEAVAAGNHGAILDMFAKGGFRMVAMKLVHLSRDEAARFYEVHRERPFYDNLVSYMSSGPIVAAILEKENAVDSFRQLIGATNPVDAEEGTVRKLYGTSIEENAVHGSDSDENAEKEAGFFFSADERVS